MTINLKACTKCSGDLYLDRDQYGDFYSCLQCGSIFEISVTPGTPKLGDPRGNRNGWTHQGRQEQAQNQPRNNGRFVGKNGPHSFLSQELGRSGNQNKNNRGKGNQKKYTRNPRQNPVAVLP